MLLIIGLGNPGGGYSKTRHNAGFLLLDYLAKKHGISFSSRECLSHTGRGEISQKPVVLAKPRTYMNLSGQAVSKLSRKYRAGPRDIIVVHDDLDLKPGQLRLRSGGSSAGHKGIESIIACLGTRDFVRLKIGIGRPPDCLDEDVVDYVLGTFTPEEQALMN
ncbi:MAG: aminoacyl-tRNA hydrolase, partial [Dehalococcoidaceae bacterium]|nr:aminoacyl-tRNA hydrolase [Dehalococcoidaceae bacterium]